MRRLDGKIALVTGASRGIGAAVARILADEGAQVVLSDVVSDLGNEVAKEINDRGGRASYLKLDVASESDWYQIANWVAEKHGTIDVLVNNAAIYERNTVDELDLELWKKVMEVNAQSVFIGTKAFIPLMLKTGGGSIINIASVASVKGSIWSTAYNASKAAVALFTKSTAVQYGKSGIRANSVHPGAIDTDMLNQVYVTDELRKISTEAIPMKRTGTPEEVAKAVLFLASDDSSYVTGSELRVDGGSLA